MRPAASSSSSLLGVSLSLSLSLSLFAVAQAVTGAPSINAAQYFVRSLPGQPPGSLVKMHAGHIEVDAPNHGNLFFWHFQNKHIANRQRTVIWLNGGPGCSSMDGTLMEVGPYRLKNDHTLEENPGSWHEFANLLFVDQPVGTGYSYIAGDSYLTELPQMADHMIKFLDKFFSMFPEYESDDIYISGESYAGQYIPYIAQAILDRNVNSKAKWNLKGLLIGNGWVDPLSHYLSYLPFAYKEGIIEPDSPAANLIEKQVDICLKTIAEKGRHVDVPQCEHILQEVLEHTKAGPAGLETCVNMYDVRLTDNFPSCGMTWPPDLVNMNPYLRRKDVLEALHVNPDKKSGWTECAGAVSATFRATNSTPAVDLLPNLLAHLPVLLFSGDRDLICNHIGTEELIHSMSFNGGTGFELDAPGTWAPREDWVFEGEPAGIYQSARNLTYVLFYNASHMVPFDYPRRTRDMLDRFMNVDIGHIGGVPTDSTIAGAKGPITSVGGTPNSTIAAEKEKLRVDKARWDAYYRSGEIALVFVAIAAAVWGVFVYRQRRGYHSRHGSDSKGAYKGVGIGLKQRGRSSEDELSDLTTPAFERDLEGQGRERRYSIGSEDSEAEASGGKVK